MNLKLLIAYLSTLLVLVSAASSGDTAGKQQQNLKRLFTGLTSKISPFSANLTAVERLQAVLTALKAEAPSLQLDTSAGDDDDLKTLIAQNGKLFAECYENTVKGQEVDLFRRVRGDVLQAYFNHHSDLLEDGSLETIFKRIRGLLENINFIARRVPQCIKEAKEGVEEPTQIGLTSMAAYTDEENQERSANSFSFNSQVEKEQDDVYHFNQTKCTPLHNGKIPSSFDWRNHTPSSKQHYSVVTPIKDQNPCGSCFVFGATASMESAYMLSPLNNRTNQTIFSEQALLNCAMGSCATGGIDHEVIIEAFYTGLTDSWRRPYRAKQEQCDLSPPVVARPSGMCQSRHLDSDETIQRLVMENGPAAMGIHMGDKEFFLLKGSWNIHCKGNRTNHAITTVGWDEHHFIIKNSWGKHWGRDGYFYLKKDGKARCAFRNRITIPTFGRKDDHHRDDIHQDETDHNDYPNVDDEDDNNEVN